MITGTITTIDYLKAQRLNRKKAELRWFTVSSFTIAVGLILLALGMGLTSLFFLAGGIGGIIGELVSSFGVLPRKARRLHSQQKDLAFPFTYTWDSEFLECKGISGQARRPWTNYVRVKENNEFILLYHADNLFEVFPKRWFSNQAQMEEFRRFAKRAGT